MVQSPRLRVLGASLSILARFAIVAAGAGLLAACQESPGLNGPRAYQPIPAQTVALMAEKGTTKQSPMLIRTYKKEAEFELWKMRSDGRYALLKTYPMCRWSGQLGPKVREGDRQVPEGFYAIAPGQMNPNSAYYLSFNIGYPNAYDRAHGASGGAIMVHGACSSAGCLSMTDQQIAEIYAIARESFAGGQREIQMQSYPFHMTAENLAKHRADPNIAFWKQLKEGADNFEVTKAEPKVGVCGRHYVFNSTPENPGQRLEADAACPPLKQDAEIASLVGAKQHLDEQKIAELAQSGVKAVRLVYAEARRRRGARAEAASFDRKAACLAGEAGECRQQHRQTDRRFAADAAGRLFGLRADLALIQRAPQEPFPIDYHGPFLSLPDHVEQ